MRYHIDKESEISECTPLAQKDYKNVRHDKIAAAIHRELCKKHGFEYAEKSYNHNIDKESRVLENEEVKILWDFTIQTEKKLEYNKPDLVILAKKEYTDLKYELPKVRKGEVTKVFILPIIKGAVGTMTKNVQENPDNLKIDIRVWDLQKIGLLGTSRVQRKVLDS